MSRSTVLHVAAVEFTASRLLAPQLAFLSETGYDVRLACAPQGEQFEAKLQPFDPIPLSFPRSLDPAAMARASMDLQKIVRRIRPALVHFHSPAAALPGRIMLSRRSGPKVAYTVHGFLQTWDRPTARDRVLDRIERALSRRTDVLLFQSAEDLERARAHSYRGRLEYLGNGVADDRFIERESQRRAGPVRAVFVGRLTKEKGLAELLEAAEGVPELELVLVGDALPSDRDSFAAEAQAAAARSRGRIRLTGMVPPHEVAAHLADADLFVLPSWREGVPRSVIEAMASGLPVVATSIRGCRELVEPGVTGWLVEPRNATALAAALAEATSLSHDALAQLGAAGRARAWATAREADVFDRLAAAYRSVGVTA